MQLLKICQPFMAAVVSLCRVTSYREELEQAITSVKTHWIECQEMVYKQGWSKSWSDDAIFALAVWADEQIFLSPFADKLPWEPLQLVLTDTRCGGEEFFSRLEALFTYPSPLAEDISPDSMLIHEVCALFGACLATGFKGCYYHHDTAILQRFRERIMEQLGMLQETSPVVQLQNAPSKTVISYWHPLEPLNLLLIAATLVGTLWVLLIYQELLATDLLQWPS